MVERAGAEVASLPTHIRRWIARTLAVGYRADAVCRTLTELGYDESACRSEITELSASPAFEAAVELASSRHKLALLLDTLAHQFRRTRSAATVATMDPPDPDDFFEHYYYGNRPVVVRGLMRDWPALHTWTPEWIAERYGHVAVEVTAGRDDDAFFEDHFERHRTDMALGDFIAAITTTPGNDRYLVSKNRLLHRPELADLLADFPPPAGFLRSSPGLIPGLWLGSAGTTTPLHHDSSNIFFGQIFGRKRVRLIPPFEIGNLYNDRSCFSAVDIDSPDLVRFPRFADVAVMDAVVGPGDFLLLPVGWWHTVQSLSTSISLSFQNFAIDGRAVLWRWREPGLPRE